MVSILVFLDDAHRLSASGAATLAGLMAFQSLFSWMTLIGAARMRAYRRTPKGFQSLFSWMTLIGGQKEGTQGARNRFQSLFSWMTLIGQARNERLWETDWVSILVFLDDAHRPRARMCLPSRSARFNPCFLG